MGANGAPDDLSALTGQTREIWDRNAGWWDETVGEGNRFQRELVGPATERLLDVRAGEEVLDVACGNGLFSRRLAQLGARVVACDFSQVFLDHARARMAEQEHKDRIEYRLIDATDRGQLLALGARRFDAAVCSMALMDMPAIDPLLGALRELLKPGGRFVFSVSHPCFNSVGCRMAVEQELRDGELVSVYSVRVLGYLNLPPTKGVGIAGQPVSQYYFDRPVSVLFNACFREGFVLDGMEEPAFSQGANAETPLSWVNYRDIPPALVARMRLPSSP